MDLKATVERNDTVPGRTFDLVMQSLILISIITFTIETLPDIEADTRKFLHATEVVIVILFTIEYLLRLYVADRKLGYVLSFYGVIDLLAILPFYLASGIDLRSLRVFRMFRLFRLLKLLRFGRAMRRFARAFIIAKEEIILFSVVTVMLLYLSAVGIYYFEHSEEISIIYDKVLWPSN